MPIFGITYFTQLHGCAIFLALGIGADDVFVFTDAWKQNKQTDKSLLEKIKFRSMILPDRFIEHNDPKKMYEEAGLDSQAIENKIYEIIDSKILAQKQN